MKASMKVKVDKVAHHISLLEFRRKHFARIMEQNRKVLEGILLDKTEHKNKIGTTKNKIEAAKALAKMVGGWSDSKEIKKETKDDKKELRELSEDEIADIDKVLNGKQ